MKALASLASMCLLACACLLAAPASAEVRTWKDRTGKFSIQAELVEFDGTTAKLKKADGKTIQIAVDRLSEEDRRFLEAQAKSAFGDSSAAKDAPAPPPAPPAGTKAGGLRYAWKAGQAYPYKVKIEVDLGDTALEMTGTPSYTVVSADKDRAVLNFRGTLMEHERAKDGQASRPPMGPRGPRGPGRLGGPRFAGPGPRMRSPFSPMTGVGLHGLGRGTELTVDPLGHIARQEGTSQLPFLLGNLSQLMIETLPGTDEPTWTVAHGSGVVIKEEGIPRFGPFANEEGFVPARERTVYTIESATDKQAVIRKQYEFRAAATGSDKPPFEISGEGKYTFNKEQGVSGDLDFTMKVTFRKGGLSIDVPVKATYHLVSEEERAAMAKAAKEAQAEAKRPLAPTALADVLADLKSGEQDRLIRATRQLATKSPEKPDPQIAKALESLAVAHENTFVRVQAAKALENWSTPENVPGLIKALDDKFPMVCTSAIKALAKHKAEGAIGPIVTKLGDGGTRGPATEFLKAVGPAAEPAVIKQLESLDPAVRREAAAILKVIGTHESVPALEKATNDPDVFVKSLAKEALAAAKTRP